MSKCLNTQAPKCLECQEPKCPSCSRVPQVFECPVPKCSSSAQVPKYALSAPGVPFESPISLFSSIMSATFKTLHSIINLYTTSANIPGICPVTLDPQRSPHFFFSRFYLFLLFCCFCSFSFVFTHSVTTLCFQDFKCVLAFLLLGIYIYINDGL